MYNISEVLGFRVLIILLYLILEHFVFILSKSSKRRLMMMLDGARSLDESELGFFNGFDFFVEQMSSKINLSWIWSRFKP